MRAINKSHTRENVRKVYYIHFAGRGGFETSTYARNIRQTERARGITDQPRNRGPNLVCVCCFCCFLFALLLIVLGTEALCGAKERNREVSETRTQKVQKYNINAGGMGVDRVEWG